MRDTSRRAPSRKESVISEDDGPGTDPDVRFAVEATFDLPQRSGILAAGTLHSGAVQAGTVLWTGAGRPVRVLGVEFAGPSQLRSGRVTLLVDRDDAAMIGSGTVLAGHSPVPDEWRIGDVVEGLYDIRDVLRTGGMGVVYRAWHREWDVDLAVKVPRTGPSASADVLRDFVTEAETWVSLGRHPHTVDCVYVRTIDGVPCVFAEWVDGGDLATLVRDRGLYRGTPQEVLARVLDVAIQIAWGLGHAHDGGLVHQDVKPANVMLTSDGTVKVTDFGLARARAAVPTPAPASRQAPTGASVRAGFGGMTPAYCSPEQAAAAAGGPTTLTRATDVWSWALCVLEMFTGAPPTRFGQAGAEVLAAFVEAGASAGAPVPALPGALAALLGRCLAADPAARPARMSDLVEDLVAMHAELVGRRYDRPRPEAARLLADGLSNQALSLLDLGRPEQAEDLWARALAVDPTHLHTVHNRGLHRWRAGSSDDRGLLTALGMAASGENAALAAFLIGSVHLERGDTGAAVEALTDAHERSPGDDGTRRRLELARMLHRDGVELTGHTRAVTSVALAAGAGLLLTGGADGTVRAWDVTSGRCLRTMAHGDGDDGVADVGLTPDGRLAVSAGYDGTVRTWHLPDGAPGVCVAAHDGSVRGVAVDADGTLLLSAGDDGRVRLWSAATGTLVRTLEDGRAQGPLWRSGRVAFAGTALAVVSGGHDAMPFEPAPPGSGTVWRVPTGDRVAALPDRVGNTAVSAGGEVVLGCSAGGTVLVWRSTGPELLHDTRCAGAGDALAVTADGSVLVTSGPPDGGEVIVWTLPEGRRVRTIDAHRYRVTAVAVSADGGVAVTGSEDRTARVWHLMARRPPAPWSYARPRTAVDLGSAAGAVASAKREIARSLAAGELATAAREVRAARDVPGHRRDPELLDAWWRATRTGRRTAVVAAWRATTVAAHRASEWNTRLRTPVALVGDAPTVVAGLGDGTIAVSDPLGRREAAVLGPGGPAVVGIAVSADGRVALASDADGVVTIRDLTTGRGRPLVGGRAGLVTISDDGTIGACADAEGDLRVWDLPTTSLRRHLRAAGGFVQALATDAAGTVAVTCGVAAPTSVWDLRARRTGGRPVRTLDGHRGFVRCAAVAADGSGAVTGSDDRTVRLWDLRTGSCARVLAGHTAEVFTVTLHRDVVVSGGPDSTVRIWDRATGGCRHVLTGHTGTVGALALSDDGRFVLSGSTDRSVRVWDTGSGACLHTLTGHDGTVDRVAFGLDTRFVLAGCTAGQAVVWELDWDVSPEPDPDPDPDPDPVGPGTGQTVESGPAGEPPARRPGRWWSGRRSR